MPVAFCYRSLFKGCFLDSSLRHALVVSFLVTGVTRVTVFLYGVRSFKIHLWRRRQTVLVVANVVFFFLWPHFAFFSLQVKPVTPATSRDNSFPIDSGLVGLMHFQAIDVKRFCFQELWKQLTLRFRSFSFDGYLLCTGLQSQQTCNLIDVGFEYTPGDCDDGEKNLPQTKIRCLQWHYRSQAENGRE